uniref:DUF4267 domain-containing protein n=1 Tax=Chrysotila carterae TaxID=13221 RepID=A0A7S4BCT6_CHRCT
MAIIARPHCTAADARPTDRAGARATDTPHGLSSALSSLSCRWPKYLLPARRPFLRLQASTAVALMSGEAVRQPLVSKEEEGRDEREGDSGSGPARQANVQLKNSAQSLSASDQLEGIPWIAHILRQLGAAIMSFGLIALGVLCFFAPYAAADMYGMPIREETDALGWVVATGIRDLGLGVATCAFAARRPSALRVFVPTLIPVAAGDAWATMMFSSSAEAARMGTLKHLAGTVAICILAVAAWLDPTLDERRAVTA